MSEFRVRACDASELAARRSELEGLERSFRYPLGDDSFRIDHGTDYLAFARRLGEPEVFIAERGDSIVGLLIAVLREQQRRTWYLCDLKVAAVEAGASLAMRLYAAFDSAHRDGLPRFGVSMDREGAADRLVAIARRRGAHVGPRLSLFQLDTPTWHRRAEGLRERLGDLELVDLEGLKDIIVGSSEIPLRLLHVCVGATPTAVEPSPDSIQMLCLREDDPAALWLRQAGCPPSASATVISTAPLDVDWRRFSSAEI